MTIAFLVSTKHSSKTSTSKGLGFFESEEFGYGVLIRGSVHMSVLLYVHQLFLSPFPLPSTKVAHSRYQFCYISPLFWYCIHL